MIHDFETLDLHDTPVKSLKLTFEERRIDFTVYQYDDPTKEYFDLNIIFYDVSDFKLDMLPDVYIDEITTFELEKRDDKYYVNFILLYNHPPLEINMSFLFGDVKIEHPVTYQPHRIS